jgi:aldose 1-epimerase
MKKARSREAEAFGVVQGRPAWAYTLENSNMRARVTDYGGILVSVEAPDREGRMDHVVLGFEDAGSYFSYGGSFGAIIGRCANRIAGGRFKIDGICYETSKNDRGSTLHGGEGGFGRRFWSVLSATQDCLTLALVSEDGDQGFPGQLSVKATYTLTGSDLELSFVASTTKATPVSLSSHPYFNLDGSSAGDCLAHLATIEADEYLETDANQIPTGKRKRAAGSAFDFRTARPVGERIREMNAQLEFGCGYDHFYLIPEADKQSLRPAARVVSSQSGRALEILTTQPGIQLYTGNQLNGSMRGRTGLYRQSAGLAIEPSGFPNAVNEATFPSALLRPGEVYRQTTIYRFSSEQQRRFEDASAVP